MILLWNSSTMTAEMVFVDGDSITRLQWEANRTLARDMLAHLERELVARGSSLKALKGIGVYRGPGSFTGLRIGLTVLNTLATDRHVPIVGETGNAWEQTCLERLSRGENDQLVMPEYGSEAHITKPRK